MPRRNAHRLPLLLLPLLAIAACSSLQTKATNDLNARLQKRLAPDITAGRAVVEPLPDGARVTLVEQVLYPRGGTTMDDQGINVLTHVVQSLVEPSLLQITVTASPNTPEYLKAARMKAVLQDLAPAMLGNAVQPDLMVPDNAAAPGPTITIKVVTG
jgi:hypothetical protein